MERALGLCCAVILGGCEGIVGDRDLGADPAAYQGFDLTNDADRGQFIPTDLEYSGSVGPYAMYIVTGPAPRLDGPVIRFAGGYAVLRGASTYFTPSMHAPEVNVSLAGVATAEAQLPSLSQIAVRGTGCATVKDGSAKLSS